MQQTVITMVIVFYNFDYTIKEYDGCRVVTAHQTANKLILINNASMTIVIKNPNVMPVRALMIKAGGKQRNSGRTLRSAN